MKLLGLEKVWNDEATEKEDLQQAGELRTFVTIQSGHKTFKND
jgi:hypothetical protein